jgi:hypothetical protein
METQKKIHTAQKKVYTAQKKEDNVWRFNCSNCRRQGGNTVVVLQRHAIFNPTEWNLRCPECNHQVTHYKKCDIHCQANGDTFWFWTKFREQECPRCIKEKELDHDQVPENHQESITTDTDTETVTDTPKSKSKSTTKKEKSWKAPCTNCGKQQFIPVSHIKNPDEHDLTCGGCHKQAMTWSHCDTHNINHWTNTAKDCPKCIAT